jgi:hypothetical protein
VDVDPVDLAPDCDSCFGLCCVLLPFRAQDGFGADKAGGEPCGHLELVEGADRCRIHHRLEESGWPGCVAFDCRGAGQHVAQVTYASVSWRDRDEPWVRAEMGAVLSVVRVIHGLLAELDPGDPAFAELLAVRGGSPEQLLALDLDEIEQRVQRGRRQTTTDWPGGWPRRTGRRSAGTGAATTFAPASD